MQNPQIFEYESDWFSHFNAVLRNEIREDIDNKNLIKASIIESNQTIEDFVKRNEGIQLIPSKEKFFYNIRIRNAGPGDKEYYIYVNVKNPRFWIVHNIEYKKDIQALLDNLVSNSYLQDKIYLSHQTMDAYRGKTRADSLGFTLNFEQKFSSQDGDQVFVTPLDRFEDVEFTMQLWPKRKRSLDFFLEKFKEIKCPINFRSLNFVFEDEEEEVQVKEDLFFDGTLTVHRGKDLKKHVNFVEEIRKEYAGKIQEIEEREINWQKMAGNVFQVEFHQEINPKAFIQHINQEAVAFKINAFFMSQEEGSSIFNCVDLHTGDVFYLQVFPEKMNVRLQTGTCGNVLSRLFTNLQRYLSTECSLNYEGTKFLI